jgi:hypothetical protein
VQLNQIEIESLMENESFSTRWEFWHISLIRKSIKYFSTIVSSFKKPRKKGLKNIRPLKIHVRGKERNLFDL